jgi:4-amino-4-deoxy-L-arabinose transferase-like glycosyltransferase
VLFFVALGAVMTDLVLVVCVNVALLAFWQRIHQQDHPSEWDRSQWVFFIAVGLGLLTKGPLAAFLVAAPILVWALLCGRLLDTWRRMSWLRGGLIVGLVALPWYIAAEWKYPGFLRYFLIGENLQRFLVTDWKGDLYGPVHEVPHGAIWLFLSLGALPWSLLAPFAGFRARGAIRSNWHKHRELALFAGVSTLVPMVLFTVAQNVIAPYALPALVPLVIAAVVLLGEDMLSTRFMLGTAATAAATGFLLTVGSAMLSGAIERESERELVAAAKIEAPLQALHYWRHRYYSADYYSSGQTSVLHETDEIQRLLEGGTPFLLAMTDADFSDLPAEIASSLRRTGAYSKKVIFSPKSLLANEAVQWAHP